MKPAVVRNTALEIVERVSVTARQLMAATGCTSGTAQQVLSALARENLLQRVALGTYVKPGSVEMAPVRESGAVTAARAKRDEYARQLAAAEAWLSDCPKLPPCPPPNYGPRTRRVA